MKIFIVDDEKENLYLLEAMLKGSGYEVISASNGVEALEKLRAEGSDLIISDILMPVMDGFQLCRECRGDNELKDIPFIFYTATYTDVKDEELAFGVGADKFIRKPMEPDEFVKTIKGVIADVAKSKVEPKKTTLEEEKEVFKLYSERLVKKLEKKMLDLEREITERKRMEEQLIVTDRLASIGELASGIAHELNNPLTSVIGFAQLLLEKDVADDVKEDVKIIYSEAQRTAEVVKNLLTFARKHPPVKQLVNINSIIEKVLELRAYEQKVNNIQVNTRFATDLPEIMADYFQLQQVFLNITINAEHFMIEGHNRGALTITTEKVGNIIKASFADDGPGIPKENLGHLFDPFFTTKEVGKGTGLGLSICHGIIVEHGGRIYAESKLGKGATFVVELPITIDEEGAVK